MNPFENITLPIAKKRKSFFNLSCQTLTTGEFSQVVPVKCIEVLPNDHIKIDTAVLARCAPLACATYAEAMINMKAFFVPFRSVFSSWDRFITNQKTIVGTDNPSTTVLPRITVKTLIECFVNESLEHLNRRCVDMAFNDVEYNADHEKACDIYLKDPKVGGSRTFRHDGIVVSDDVQYFGYVLTPYGRMWLKILTNLGYQWNWSAQNKYESFNALPLLAFFKIFAQFYVPSQRRDIERSALVRTLEQIFNDPSKLYDDGTNLTAYAFVRDNLMLNIDIAYPADFFTSAWVKPNSVLSYSGQKKIDGDTGPYNPYDRNGSAQQPSYYAYTYDYNTYADSKFISEQLLRQVRAVTNFVTRNNYAGSNAVRQILARFGVKVHDPKEEDCYYLGNVSTPLRISDVTQTATTSEGILGELGGKALAYDEQGHFTYDAKEHGVIIILSSIMPKVTRYYQGCSPLVTRKSPLSFYTPEFDCVGMEAIPRRMLQAGYYKSTPSEAYGTKENNVFGFVPRYSDYRYPVGMDTISGDFRVPSLKEGLSSFHSFRMFNEERYTEGEFDCQGSMIYYDLDHNSQYNRIFAHTANDVDHFYMIYNFNIGATRSMTGISESSVLLDEKDNQGGSTSGNIVGAMNE